MLTSTYFGSSPEVSVKCCSKAKSQFADIRFVKEYITGMDGIDVFDQHMQCATELVQNQTVDLKGYFVFS